MKVGIRLTLINFLLALSAVRHAYAGSLVAISGDPTNSFVPYQFSTVAVSLPSVNTVATLGDGSLGFNGGLTAGVGGVVYGIANDSLRASSFYSIRPMERFR